MIIPNITRSWLFTVLSRCQWSTGRPTQTSGTTDAPHLVVCIAQSHPVGLEKGNSIFQHENLNGALSRQIRIRDGNIGNRISIAAELKSRHSVSANARRS